MTPPFNVWEPPSAPLPSHGNGGEVQGESKITLSDLSVSRKAYPAQVTVCLPCSPQAYPHRKPTLPCPHSRVQTSLGRRRGVLRDFELMFRATLEATDHVLTSPESCRVK